MTHGIIRVFGLSKLITEETIKIRNKFIVSHIESFKQSFQCPLKISSLSRKLVRLPIFLLFFAIIKLVLSCKRFNVIITLWLCSCVNHTSAMGIAAKYKSALPFMTVKNVRFSTSLMEEVTSYIYFFIESGYNIYFFIERGTSYLLLY